MNIFTMLSLFFATVHSEIFVFYDGFEQRNRKLAELAVILSGTAVVV